VLARYSGEFTVFRELLQNSDDAQSEAVDIRFETQAFLSTKGVDTNIGGGGSVVPPDLEARLPDLRTTHVSCNLLPCSIMHSQLICQVHQWTFKNNGMVFRDEDWSRLKKIGGP